MKQLYCPNCAILRNTYYSTSKETILADDESILPIINISYYCEECTMFIESEIKPDKYSDYESTGTIKIKGE